MKYVCKLCGKEFESKHVVSICDDCKVQTCVVCGKEFELKYPYTAKTCSSKCRGIYRKKSGVSKRVYVKAKNTLEERYGVSNPSKLLKSKKCIACGKEFIPKSNAQKYCDGPHYGKCPVCGKRVLIRDMNVGPQTCSEACRIERIQITSKERYGNAVVMNSEYGRNKSKETCENKYGVQHYSKTSEYLDKFETTMKSRYGVRHALQNQEIKQRQHHTNFIKYGGVSPMCDEAVKEKASNTVIQNFGGFGFASDVISDKIHKTNLDRYGDEIPSRTKDIIDKIQSTCLDRYGNKSYFGSRCDIENRMLDSSKIYEYIKFSEDPEHYIKSNYDYIPTCYEVCKDVGVSDTTVYYALISHGVRDLVTYHQSSMECEIYNWIHDRFPGITIRRNVRDVISPYEIDLYFPEYEFGIECNPTITHNSSVKDPWGNIKSRGYHKMKSDMCRSRGVFLFHIFGYEWKCRKSLILNMISNILEQNQERIYARNTYIDANVAYQECIDFLNNNHRQGAANSHIRIGLRSKDDGSLCSVMTFSKMRTTIGKVDDSNSYELVRFCSKSGINVVGGASKLFKWFVRNYDFDSIVSFSDIAHTTGNLYKILGFHEVSESNPGYVWVRLEDDFYRTRVSCQKKNLINMFDDISEDYIKDHSEKEIMEQHGYVQVFDSGVIRWEYR